MLLVCAAAAACPSSLHCHSLAAGAGELHPAWDMQRAAALLQPAAPDLHLYIPVSKLMCREGRIWSRI